MSVRPTFLALSEHLNAAVLGQDELCRQLLIALLADGHLLLEGPPGLAKTRVIRKLAELVDGRFQRIQFTPDLLPADLTGCEIYRPQEGRFHFEAGPLFHEFILADEINRAPAKVQSALLEAMAERQVTQGLVTHPLPPLFLVMATQNPIEHEGTHPLPEAQLDRFLMHVAVDYPALDTEQQILALARDEARRQLSGEDTAAPRPLAGPDEILAARREVLDLYLSPDLADYIVRLVAATRHPDRVQPDLAGCIQFGASPRGSIALERCARARAWLAGRDYVSPDDILAQALPVLRHRLVLSYAAQAEGLTPDRLIQHLLAHLPRP